MDTWLPKNLVEPDGSASAARGKPAMPMLDSILDAAEQLAPGTHLGISGANDGGTYTTLAGTGPLVFMLDQLQYDLDEGPTLTAMRQGHTVIVDDAESEHRWPTFIPRAVDLGLRSYLGMPVSDDRTTLGGLSMYATTRTPVDVPRLAHARLLADQAAIALAQAQRVTDLLAALQSSRTIGKAIGLMMERLNLDDHEAFEHLAMLSQRSNVKLRDIAAQMVTQSNKLRHAREATPLLHKPPSLGLTLDGRPDAPGERHVEARTAVRSLTTSTVQDEIATAPADL